MAKRLLGPVYLFFAFTLAGTSVVTARFVSGRLGIFTITAASLFFAALFLLAAKGGRIIRTLKALPLNGYLPLVFQALFGIFLFRMFLLSGLQGTSALEAGILTSATPAMTAVLAMAFLKEKATGGKLIGIALTVAGIALIQGVLSREGAFASDHLPGNMLVLCAASCEAMFNIFSRRFAVKRGDGGRLAMDPWTQTFLVSGTAFLFCLVPALLEQPVWRLGALPPEGWAALIWYGIFVTALAFLCWYGGIRRAGALTAAAFSGMMPLTAALLSMFLLKESTAWHQLAGGALVLAGMVWSGMGAALRKGIGAGRQRNCPSAIEYQRKA